MISRSPSSIGPLARARVLAEESKRSTAELRPRHRPPSFLHPPLRLEYGGRHCLPGMPGGIRTRDPRVPLTFTIRPAAAGVGPAKVFARCSARLSYGHHEATSCGQGWPTGIEPVPPGAQPGVLPLNHGHHTVRCVQAGVTDGDRTRVSGTTARRSAIELRPPRACFSFSLGRRERPVRHEGSRCSTRAGAMCAPPALRTTALLPSASSIRLPALVAQNRTAPPAVCAGGAAYARSR